VTRIKYSVGKTAVVTLKIFDVLGREIESLIDERKHPGVYYAEFDGANLSSGIYFYELLIDGAFFSSKKMALIR